jgi:hypothetical protein
LAHLHGGQKWVAAYRRFPISMGVWSTDCVFVSAVGKNAVAGRSPNRETSTEMLTSTSHGRHLLPVTEVV